MIEKLNSLLKISRTMIIRPSQLAKF